jgi:hypothetical protein
MHTGRRHAYSERSEFAHKQRAELAQLGDRVANGPVRSRPELESRLVRLRRAPAREIRSCQLEDLIAALGQAPAHWIEEHYFLLDSDGVGL